MNKLAIWQWGLWQGVLFGLILTLVGVANGNTLAQDEIKVYYLPVGLVDGTEVVKGIDIIHDASLEVEGKQRKLIMRTTDEEHNALIKLATSWRVATQAEANRLTTLPSTASAVSYKDLYQTAKSDSERIDIIAQSLGLK